MYQKQSNWEQISISINIFLLDLYVYINKLFQFNKLKTKNTHSKNPHLKSQ